jgi:uncharacterized membrane protein YphA (DoxX/SURF4 family)
MRLREFAKKLDNPGLGLDVLRVYLGIALFVRGAMFVAEPDALTSFMQHGRHWLVPLFISHYVVGAHIAGGILLALGLVTRWAAFAQVPILLGATLFVHWGEGLLSAGQSLELSALVLVSLLVIGTFGAGHFSLDYELARRALPSPPLPSVTPPAESEEHAHAHL